MSTKQTDTCLFVNDCTEPGRSQLAKLGWKGHNLIGLLKTLTRFDWKCHVVVPAEGQLTEVLRYVHHIPARHIILEQVDTILKRFSTVTENFPSDTTHNNPCQRPGHPSCLFATGKLCSRTVRIALPLPHG